MLIQPSLRDSGPSSCSPSDESLGYFQMSLRDTDDRPPGSRSWCYSVSFLQEITTLGGRGWWRQAVGAANSGTVIMAGPNVY
jgi:hypothetical protein